MPLSVADEMQAHHKQPNPMLCNTHSVSGRSKQAAQHNALLPALPSYCS
jgi:hypothetical protein